MPRNTEIKREQSAADLATMGGGGPLRDSFAFKLCRADVPSATRIARSGCVVASSPSLVAFVSISPPAEVAPGTFACSVIEAHPSVGSRASVQSKITPMTEQRRCRAA